MGVIKTPKRKVVSKRIDPQFTDYAFNKNCPICNVIRNIEEEREFLAQIQPFCIFDKIEMSN